MAPVSREIVETFRERPLGMTTRQLCDAVNRGVNPARGFISARLLRAMATATAPYKFNPGDGAHLSDDKPYLQDIREIDPAFGDKRAQVDMGRE